MSQTYTEFMGQKLKEIIVTLPFTDGSVKEFGVYAYFEVQGKEYFALLPFRDKKKLDFTHKFALYTVYKDADGNPVVTNIENDDDFNAAAAYFSMNYNGY